MKWTPRDVLVALLILIIGMALVITGTLRYLGTLPDPGSIELWDRILMVLAGGIIGYIGGRDRD